MQIVTVVFSICTVALLVSDGQCLPPGLRPSARVQHWILENPTYPEVSAIETSFNHLVKYGYSRVPPRNMNWKAFENALRRYQRRMHIPITGEPDASTLWKMGQPRCGKADEHGIGHYGQRIEKRYALHDTKWPQQHFTYKITAYTNKLTEVQVRESVTTAFALWSKVTSLTFTPTICSQVDIEIKFVRGEHGDKYPFYGPGGEIAHAFFPGSIPVAGDVHMDDDEPWTVTPYQNINALSVLAHELGHSVGLEHSTVSTALMEALYTGRMDLHDDDKAGIRAMYGDEHTDWNTADSRISESCVDRSPGYPAPTSSTTSTPTSLPTTATTQSPTTSAAATTATTKNPTPTPTPTPTTTTPTTSATIPRSLQCCFRFWGFCWWYC